MDNENIESSREVDIHTDSHIDTNKNNRIQSMRIYSAEVECYANSDSQDDDIREVITNMPNTLGYGSDGSLNSYGWEFQTPRLSGNKGIEYISQLCGLLDNNNFTVDNTCGLHIHIDGGKKYLSKSVRANKKVPTLLKNLLLFYLYYDDVIMAMLPNSRRNNKYCISLNKNYNSAEVSKCNTLDELEQLWYKNNSKDDIRTAKSKKYDNSRYSGINFHSLLSNNHIEVRFHSGTINANKIINWIILHVAIMDRIEKIKVDWTPRIIEKTFKTTLYDKFEEMVTFLKLDYPMRRYLWKRIEKFTPSVVDSDNESSFLSDNNPTI